MFAVECRFGESCFRPCCPFQHGKCLERMAVIQSLAVLWKSMADATERQGAQLALREPLHGPQLHDPVDGRSAPPATCAAQLPCEAAEDPQQEAPLHAKPEQRLASAQAVPQEVQQPDDHGEIVPGGSVCGSGRPDASSPCLASCEG